MLGSTLLTSVFQCQLAPCTKAWHKRWLLFEVHRIAVEGPIRPFSPILHFHLWLILCLLRFMFLYLSWCINPLWCLRYTPCQAVPESYVPLPQSPPDSLGGGRLLQKGMLASPPEIVFLQGLLLLSISRPSGWCWRGVLYCGRPQSGQSMLLSKNVGPLYGVKGSWFQNWRFGSLLRLAARAHMIFPRPWAGKMRHFDAFRDCDKHKRHYGAPSAKFVECNHVVALPELEYISWALTITIFRPHSLWILVCLPLFENEIALKLPFITICWRPDVNLLPLKRRTTIWFISSSSCFR